jgi:hypothetical protein
VVYSLRQQGIFYSIVADFSPRPGEKSATERRQLPLISKVALVARATRSAGRGIAVELGTAGATVYVTGRSTRAQRSEYDHPKTIEETAEMVSQAGGRGIVAR